MPTYQLDATMRYIIEAPDMAEAYRKAFAKMKEKPQACGWNAKVIA